LLDLKYINFPLHLWLDKGDDGKDNPAQSYEASRWWWLRVYVLIKLRPMLALSFACGTDNLSSYWHDDDSDWGFNGGARPN